MADNSDKAALLSLTIAEFNALRGEIKDRSATAYTLLNINITGDDRYCWIRAFG